jgi:hypothetical protein
MLETVTYARDICMESILRLPSQVQTHLLLRLQTLNGEE